MNSDEQSVGIPLTEDGFRLLLDRAVPLAGHLGIQVESLGQGTALLRLPYSAKLLRPGGTHSGPSLMALADLAGYAAILSLDRADESALTTRLSIDFLRRPPESDLIASCEILKKDALTVVARIMIFPEGDSETVIAVCSCTYTLLRRI